MSTLTAKPCIICDALTDNPTRGRIGSVEGRMCPDCAETCDGNVIGIGEAEAPEVLTALNTLRPWMRESWVGLAVGYEARGGAKIALDLLCDREVIDPKRGQDGQFFHTETAWKSIYSQLAELVKD